MSVNSIYCQHSHAYSFICCLWLFPLQPRGPWEQSCSPKIYTIWLGKVCWPLPDRELEHLLPSHMYTSMCGFGLQKFSKNNTVVERKHEDFPSIPPQGQEESCLWPGTDWTHWQTPPSHLPSPSSGSPNFSCNLITTSHLAIVRVN